MEIDNYKSSNEFQNKISREDFKDSTLDFSEEDNSGNGREHLQSDMEMALRLHQELNKKKSIMEKAFSGIKFGWKSTSKFINNTYQNLSTPTKDAISPMNLVKNTARAYVQIAKNKQQNDKKMSTWDYNLALANQLLQNTVNDINVSSQVDKAFEEQLKQVMEKSKREQELTLLQEEYGDSPPKKQSFNINEIDIGLQEVLLEAINDENEDTYSNSNFYSRTQPINPPRTYSYPYSYDNSQSASTADRTQSKPQPKKQQKKLKGKEQLLCQAFQDRIKKYIKYESLAIYRETTSKDINQCAIRILDSHEKNMYLEKRIRELKKVNYRMTGNQKHQYKRGTDWKVFEIYKKNRGNFTMGEITLTPAILNLHKKGKRWIQIKNRNINSMGKVTSSPVKSHPYEDLDIDLQYFSREAEFMEEPITNSRFMKIIIKQWKAKSVSAFNSTRIQKSWTIGKSHMEVTNFKEENFKLLRNLNSRIDKKFIKVLFGIEKLKKFKCTDSKLDTYVQNVLKFSNNKHWKDLSRKLNKSQKKALMNSVVKKFSIIQGPPGTGKTKISVTIVQTLINLMKNGRLETFMKSSGITDYDKVIYPSLKSGGKSSSPPFKVLVVADSNLAVDNICKRLHLHGVNVVRVMSRKFRNKKSVDPIISKICHVMDDSSRNELSMYLKEFEQFRNTHIRAQLSKNGKYNLQKDPKFQKMNKKRQEMYSMFVNIWNKGISVNQICSTLGIRRVAKAEVLGCTFDVALNLKDSFGIEVTPNCVLIDEASQITDCKLLRLIEKNTSRIVLVGDQQQLGPIYSSRELQDFESLFEKLIKEKNEYIMLNTQYRMHPKLAQFSSENYYNGKLKSGVNGKDRDHFIYFVKTIFPKSDPRVFVEVTGAKHVQIKGGTSLYNEKEAKCATKIVKIIWRTMKKNANGNKSQLPKIAVISMYKAQSLLIEKKISKIEPEIGDYIKSETVDAFQGKEVDFVIISLVLASKEGRASDFFNDQKRQNVALTRAKHGTIVVGNSSTLRDSIIWNKLITGYYKEGCYIQSDKIMKIPLKTSKRK